MRSPDLAQESQVVVSCHCGYWTPNSGSLQEQPAFLSAEPSFALFLLHLFTCGGCGRYVPCMLQLTCRDQESVLCSMWVPGIELRFSGWVWNASERVHTCCCCQFTLFCVVLFVFLRQDLNYVEFRLALNYGNSPTSAFPNSGIIGVSYHI